MWTFNQEKMTKCLLAHLPAWEMIQLSWAVQWEKCEMKKNQKMQPPNLKDILHKIWANIINAFDQVQLPYTANIEKYLRASPYDLKEEVLVKGCVWAANNLLM